MVGRLLGLGAVLLLLLPHLPSTGVSAAAPGDPIFALVSVDGPDDPLEPGGVPRPVRIAWTYQWPAARLADAAGQQAVLAWRPPVCAAGVVTSWDAEETVPLANATVPDMVVHATSTVFIAVGNGAAGDVPLQCTFAGLVKTDRPPTQTALAEANVTFQVRYLGLVTVEVPVILQEAEPGMPLQWELRIVNHGNAATRVSFQATVEKPGWQVVAPESIDLEPNLGLSSQRLVTLQAWPAEGNLSADAESKVMVHVTTASLASPDLRGNELNVTVLGRVVGCSGACQQGASALLVAAAAAGVLVLLAIVAVIAVVVVRRRRRKTPA